MTEKKEGVHVESAFPALTQTEGNFHYSIYIGKESKTLLVWILAIGSLLLIGLGANLMQLVREERTDSREGRMIQQAIDEKRLENRAAWKELGIDGYALEDHDISDLIKMVREKHPLEKPDEP